jgi:hypothetical protein
MLMYLNIDYLFPKRKTTNDPNREPFNRIRHYQSPKKFLIIEFL